ncbi:TetR family transcriptional regulator [Siccirubricoccus sp. KC 17139]|uniref:TetR family transcriptional regulator n=1 Tax=Siccirubricoccus soli TaxID=2899147 RepID=A0ABT1DCD2_9PROT|nr:TetR/AcrR family transcriptional regulator [Siccirubricoccus soli]MCO6419601.1 TetR family transcriptional regulator [Siccirubricoccus soli]MCP2685736.1 TetR family transcriptional regulator [Siccirubricoccus soli]
MSPQLDVQGSKQDTRSRILEAALLRFAQCSYEETKLRDIAADVGVDVALVHRTFGSKERLFEEVVAAACQSRQLFSAERKELPARLAARLLEPSLDRVIRVVDPLDIFVRNLLSPEAIPILRAALARDVVEPLVPKLGDPAPQRAVLLAACLAGIGIFRHVLHVEPLLEEFDGDIEPLIIRMMETVVGAGPSAGARGSATRNGKTAPRAGKAGPAARPRQRKQGAR